MDSDSRPTRVRSGRRILATARLVTLLAAGPVSALTALSYTWNNGVSINLASVTTNTAASYTACGGYLVSGFTKSAASQGHLRRDP